MHYVAYYQHSEYVTLTEAEYAEAYQRGEEIYESSQRRYRKGQLKDYRTFVRKGVDGRRVQALGSVVERAVAKHFGLRWLNTMDTFHAPDLDHNIQARLIGVDWYGLRVYSKDRNHHRVVGCVIEKGKEHESYRIPGWINAGHGKKAEWLHDPLELKHPVYLVPQDQLHDLDQLRELCGLPVLGKDRQLVRPPDEPTWVVLRDRDGDYVMEVEGTGWETVKLHFYFTSDYRKAKVFDRDQIFPRNAEFAIGTDFVRGFAGGEAVLVKDLLESVKASDAELDAN